MPSLGSVGIMASDRMQLQNMCKKVGTNLSKNTPKGGETWQLKWHLNDEKKMTTMIVDTLPVFYYEKMVDYTPSSFDDMVFTDERIKVSLKRDKSDYHTLINAKKLGQVKRMRRREKPIL